MDAADDILIQLVGLSTTISRLFPDCFPANFEWPFRFDAALVALRYPALDAASY